MKRLFSFLLCFSFLLACTLPQVADAQTQTNYRPTADTLVDVDAATLTTDAIPDGFAVQFQFSAKRISGTLAGTIILQQTLNNVDYIPVDTFTLTNLARASYLYTVTGKPALRYRAIYSSSGTVRYLPELTILRRRE